MEHLSNKHQDHLNQHENSHTQCDEAGHTAVNVMEGQWKQQHDRDFPMEGQPLQNKYLCQKKEIHKCRTVGVTVRDSSRKVNI